MDRFSALSEPNRRRIIELIAAHGEMAASDIGSNFEISAPAVSQHLKILREAGLVAVEKRAQHRVYTLNPAGVDDMWEWLSRMRKMWSMRFDAFDALVLKEHKKQKGEKE